MRVTDWVFEQQKIWVSLGTPGFNQQYQHQEMVMRAAGVRWGEGTTWGKQLEAHCGN